MKSHDYINGKFFIIFFVSILFLAFLVGCSIDNRKCLKSHTERSCHCVCSNNVAIPIEGTYEVCDIYAKKSKDERLHEIMDN